MSRTIRIAVLSDLHFCADERGKDETHIVLSRQIIPKQHPHRDLVTLIEQSELHAQIVLCPGDITYQADQVALRSAWAAVNEIAQKLGSEHVIAATGNHDISSRNAATSPEIWEYLKQLDPKYPYPQATEIQRLFYWAEHFLVTEIGDVRVVSLNTCNSHARGKNEYLNGRVTDYTIARLQEELSKQSPKLLNVLLCHHHPMKHPDLSQSMPDYSEMRQGPKLLSMLESTGQQWIVIHGHKHSPRLDYAQGSSGDAPVVISAGSFSAILSPAYFPGAANQFYILEFDMDYISSNGTAGVIHAWDWREGQGWIFAQPHAGLKSRIPSGAGFGHKSNMSHDARAIATKFSCEERVTWAQVETEFPWVRYLTPADLEKVIRRLKSEHRLDANTEPGSIRPYELLKEPSA